MIDRSATVAGCSVTGALCVSMIHLCASACVFISYSCGDQRCWSCRVDPYPVHDEDFADVVFVLKLLGSNSHGIEETEAPVEVQAERKAATCSDLDIFGTLLSQNHHRDLWSLV